MNKHSYIFQEVKKILGNPYHESEYGLLYNEDCIKGMRLLPESICDLTFTSPPYNIGKEYEKVLSIPSYIQWCTQWMNLVHRVTSSYGSFWLNVGYLKIPNVGAAVPIPYLLWDKSPFYLNQEIVWNYGAGVACKYRLSPRNEKILWFTKNSDVYTFNLDAIRDPDVKYPNQKKNGKLRCNSLGKNPSDVWSIAKVTSGSNRMSPERTPHPAQTPIDLIKRIILGGSNTGDIIFDPFMGSGSTAVAAMQNNRFYIGFEISETYCKIAKERITRVLNEMNNNLFNWPDI